MFYTTQQHCSAFNFFYFISRPESFHLRMWIEYAQCIARPRLKWLNVVDASIGRGNCAGTPWIADLPARPTARARRQPVVKEAINLLFLALLELADLRGDHSGTMIPRFGSINSSLSNIWWNFVLRSNLSPDHELNTFMLKLFISSFNTFLNWFHDLILYHLNFTKKKICTCSERLEILRARKMTRNHKHLITTNWVTL